MTIQFFGPCDRQGKSAGGDIRSEYPVWYHQARIDELKESIDKDERMINSGMVDKLPNTQEFRNELERKKVLLSEIEKDRPVLDGPDKDKVARCYGELSEKIKDAMPTRTEMVKGLANAHEELRRDTKPCISVEGFVDIARACGVPLEKYQKQVTRKQAMRMWKIMGKALGEKTNVEYLRQDMNYGTFHPERSIDQMIREDN